jgi:hypothetical protein
MSDAMERIIADAMCKSRDYAFDAAIELCEALASEGHNAECCVTALRKFKERMPRPPSDAN